MLGIYLASALEELLEQQSQILAAFILEQKPENLILIGPSDAALSKKNDIYRKVIYLKHEEKQKLIWIKNKLEEKMEKETVWQKVYVQFDFDPLNSY